MAVAWPSVLRIVLSNFDGWPYARLSLAIPSGAGVWPRTDRTAPMTKLTKAPPRVRNRLRSEWEWEPINPSPYSFDAFRRMAPYSTGLLGKQSIWAEWAE